MEKLVPSSSADDPILIILRNGLKLSFGTADSWVHIVLICKHDILREIKGLEVVFGLRCPICLCRVGGQRYT